MNPDQLGSLVRQYVKRDEYKNIKAGPMDDADREALAEMVRDAAACAQSGRATVAAAARITTKARKPVRHQNLPAADQTDSNNDAAQQERQEEDVTVTADGASPTLTFAGSGADPRPTRTLVVEVDQPAAAAPDSGAPAKPVENSDFKLVTELDGGTIVFTYKDRLMAGKPVKGVEI